MTRSLTAPADLPAPPRRRIPALGWVGLLLALLVSLPLLAVLAAAAVPTGEAWRHVVHTTLAEMLGNSALLVLAVGLMAASAGVISAWLVSTCAFPGRRLAEVALLLPLAMPAYVSGYAYTWLLDVAGPVQSGIRAATGLTWRQMGWFPEIRSLPGAALVLAMVLYPYVYLLCRAAFLQQSTCLIEVSRTLGHSLTRSFLRVALPLARPALAAGTALVLMEVLADFGTVQHFGVRTFTTGIYETWFGMGDRGAASQLSVALLACVGMLMLAERYARGDRRYHPTTTRHPPFRPVRLTGPKAWLAFIACMMPVLLGFLIPAGTLLALAMQAGDPLSPDRYLPYAVHSLLLAAITAVLAVALAAVLAWGIRLSGHWLTRFSARVAALGYALPGSVIAVGTLMPFGLFDNALDGWTRANLGISVGLVLSGSIVALVFSYLVRFLAIALGGLESGLARLKPTLRDAARCLGASPGRAVWRVEVPLARGAMLSAALLVFVDTMKELPATLIIRPFDFDTLAVRVHTLASDERLAEASSGALLIVLVGLLPVAILTRAMRRG
ncbi:ABC transporter permease [Rhodovarius crocodyli]|uniref:ABC transporter permease n=1 Tax=Rhodovarius crocodyli TaxID=1979269 RepID=UPI00198065A3|nr:iron ABC transporter permease [Rhodovarius crocodyli]